MSKFTKGPWVTADGHGPIEGGTSVQSAHDTHLICSCTGYYGRDGAKANARLIAAAPDLLEVAEMVLGMATVDMPQALIDAAGHAAAKARGVSA